MNEQERQMVEAHKDDPWFERPTAHFRDEVRYGTPGEMMDEIDRLRAIVARLPHDRNGNPIAPGDTVACPNGHEQRVGTQQQFMTCKHDGCYIRDPGNKHQARYPLDRCYRFEGEAPHA